MAQGSLVNRTRISLPVSTLASGFELKLTVHVIDGAHPGPRVGMCAMIHGDEIEGLLILRELWRTIDPAELRGSLWLLPVANPLAMEAISRNTPTDMLDMNRQFPGQEAGWLSEQQAYTIAHGFIDKLDALVDIHAGGTFPWVDYCYVVNDAEWSRAFLSQLLYQPEKSYPGTTATHAVTRGIPINVVEIGGGYQDQATHIANGLRGLTNTLRLKGMLPGEVERRAGQVLMREMTVMRPRQGGLCVPRRRLVPGTVLEGAQPLADIVSPYTFETLETMVAPYERNIVVLARNYMTRIHPGDYGFMIGNAATVSHFD
ncbi:MAG: succinylglutamate desuccinylase/aspartoacylase family protein [Gemmatimonadota bacterium]